MTSPRGSGYQTGIVAGGALVLLLGLALLGPVATAAHSYAASAQAAPARISRVSSMIGTADGALLEGGDPAPAGPDAAPLAGLWLLGASGAALAGLALTGSALYRRYTQHVT